MLLLKSNLGSHGHFILSLYMHTSPVDTSLVDTSLVNTRLVDTDTSPDDTSLEPMLRSQSIVDVIPT